MLLTRKKLQKIRYMKQQSRKRYKKKRGGKRRKKRNKRSFRKRRKALNLRKKTLKYRRKKGGARNELFMIFPKTVIVDPFINALMLLSSLVRTAVTRGTWFSSLAVTKLLKN